VSKTTSDNPPQISAARLDANRRNAKKSCGPTDTRKTRFNARKHGLTAQNAMFSQNLNRNQKFLLYCWQRLCPRNAFEETCVANLLQTRVREDLFLEVERTVLTRKPIFYTAEADQRPFSFLSDPDGLKALDHLSRHLAHLTRVSDKEFLALLAARKESWGTSKKKHETCQPNPPEAQATEVPGKEEAPAVNRGSLEDLLADSRLVLPGEDSEEYRSLGRALWSTFQPSSLLEGFLTSDLITTQWREMRALEMQSIFLRQNSVSATCHNVGIGFGFINDAQGSQGLDSLRNYEAVLRRRFESRMKLWRKLRKEGYADAA
jgi:hypothetical protein